MLAVLWTELSCCSLGNPRSGYLLPVLACFNAIILVGVGGVPPSSCHSHQKLQQQHAQSMRRVLLVAIVVDDGDHKKGYELYVFTAASVLLSFMNRRTILNWT